MTSILKTSAGEDSDYVPFLSTVVLPGDAGVVLNTDNTALTQVWLALDPGLSLAADSWLTARDILLNLWQVQALGQVMADKLAADPFALADTMNYPLTDGELRSALEIAMQAGSFAITQALLKGRVNAANPSTNPYIHDSAASFGLPGPGGRSDAL